jgi:hypothetical protein
MRGNKLLYRVGGGASLSFPSPREDAGGRGEGVGGGDANKNLGGVWGESIDRVSIELIESLLCYD